MSDAAKAPAASPIRELVCGLPSPRRENWRLLVLQAYIDDSRQGNTFVLAGYISTVEKWEAFSADWQELLDMRPHLKLFKMNEMAQSPLRLERASWFYRVIERHVQAAVCCVVPIDELRRTARTFDWPPNFTNLEKLENPYFFAFKAIINVLAQHQDKMVMDEPIDFIFDEQTEKKALFNIWDRYRLAVPPETRRLTGKQPIFRDDEYFLPLQAADLWAWWVRKWDVNGVSDGIENLRFDWEAHRDIPRLSVTFSENDFKAEFAKSRDFRSLYHHFLSDEEVSDALRAWEISEKERD